MSASDRDEKTRTRTGALGIEPAKETTTGERPPACEVCGRVLRSDLELEQHMKIHQTERVAG